MRARVVVFPIKGRNWCFSRSVENSVPESNSAQSTTPSTLRDLWKSLSSDSLPMATNAELVVDFVSNKMNRAWIGLEKAPEGSLKNKIHGVGLWLLARVKPSEIFLKSISKEVTRVEITYPTSLNARLVRRRLRHIAMRFFLCLTFRSFGCCFAHILIGELFSEKLLQLVSDGSKTPNANTKIEHGMSKHGSNGKTGPPWVLQASKELEELLRHGEVDDGLSKCIILDICKNFELNAHDVLKYKKSG
ncbi:hypothetical protein Ancab_011856 [Ancistrocladus abbreviatus]